MMRLSKVEAADNSARIEVLARLNQCMRKIVIIVPRSDSRRCRSAGGFLECAGL